MNPMTQREISKIFAKKYLLLDYIKGQLTGSAYPFNKANLYINSLLIVKAEVLKTKLN